MERLYRVGEFAALTGVSVRTLHHYDQIGLLAPSAHSASGYRLYSERDLLCLQQILTLRYLGFPLREIRQLLRRPDFHLAASMQIQRDALRDRISELERIEAGLRRLIEGWQATGAWAWDLVARAAATVEDGLAQKGAGLMDKYYTREQMQRWEELGKLVPTEERQQIEQEWTELLRDVRASRAEDPASPKAQELADRWDRAMANLTSSYRDRGFGDLLDAVGENYRQGRFSDFEGAPQAEDFAFIERARKARGGGAT
jgi:MerR family transcriptional regulator, thiopeptide resistance regulator